MKYQIFRVRKSLTGPLEESGEKERKIRNDRESWGEYAEWLKVVGWVKGGSKRGPRIPQEGSREGGTKGVFGDFTEIRRQ